MHEGEGVAAVSALPHGERDRLLVFHSLVLDTTTSPESLVLLMDCVQGVGGPSASLEDFWRRRSLNTGKPLTPALHRSLICGMLRSVEQCHSQVRGGRRPTGVATLQASILRCMAIDIPVQYFTGYLCCWQLAVIVWFAELVLLQFKAALAFVPSEAILILFSPSQLALLSSFMP